MKTINEKIFGVVSNDADYEDLKGSYTESEAIRLAAEMNSSIGLKIYSIEG